MSGLTNAANSWRMIDKMHGLGTGYINNTADRVVQNETVSTQEKILKLETLKEFAVDLHKANFTYQKHVKMLQTLERQVEDHQREREEFDSNFVREKYQQHVQSVNTEIDQYMGDQEEVNKHMDFESINKYIRSISGIGGTDDDDEVQENVAATQQRNLRCPILNCPLANPYLNTPCRHVYSLQGILQFFIQQHRLINLTPKNIDEIPADWQVKCPVAGCQTLIQKDGLRRDYQTELTQRQLQSSSLRDSLDVVDDLS